MRVTAERYLSLQEVGDELGVSDQTVRRWVKAGELAAYKPGKEYRIKGSDLAEFLQTREVSPKAEAPPQLEAERGTESTPRRGERVATSHMEPFVGSVSGSVRVEEVLDLARRLEDAEELSYEGLKKGLLEKATA